MCAIIGMVIQKPTQKDLDIVRRLFVQSSIRGLHATGMSFLPKWSKNVETIKEAKPAEDFVKLHLHNDNLSHLVNKDGNLYLIGHCRYSTSDLEYNQPMANEIKSIVHNGVITQEMPENWQELYGYITETKNDSELVLHSLNPLEEYEQSSMAVCELDVDKSVTGYRNGKRPIYITETSNGVFFTSTKDIAERAGLRGKISEVPAWLQIKVDGDLTLMYNAIDKNENLKDLQHV